MFRSIAVLSVVVAVAFAQNSQNPLIPSGISDTCTKYLTTLNGDNTMSTCLSALNTATSAFAPGSATPSSQSISTALTSVCSDSTTNACPETTLRQSLADFWSNCQSDLNTPNNPVQPLYESLYTLAPFKSALCAKNDNGDFCALAPPTTARDVSDAATGSPSSSLTQILATLWTDSNAALKRRATVPVAVPNLNAFQSNNIPFLFLTPDLDTTRLCSTCTKEVLTAYMTYEGDAQFGPGLSNSILLGKQSALLDAVKSKCPATFLGNAIQAAGGISTSKYFGGAAPRTEQNGVIALLLGIATLAVAL